MSHCVLTRQLHLTNCSITEWTEWTEWIFFVIGCLDRFFRPSDPHHRIERAKTPHLHKLSQNNIFLGSKPGVHFPMFLPSFGWSVILFAFRHCPERVNVYLLKVYLDFCHFFVPPNLKNEVHLRDQLKLFEELRLKNAPSCKTKVKLLI